jgi:ubiquitin-like-conjugating enzyme ATG3
MMEEDAGGNTNIFASGNYVVKDLDEAQEESKEASTLKVRKYDLSINYDFYHQTPRLWLLGYSESG